MQCSHYNSLKLRPVITIRDQVCDVQQINQTSGNIFRGQVLVVPKTGVMESERLNLVRFSYCLSFDEDF